jgi:hypothetical protein
MNLINNLKIFLLLSFIIKCSIALADSKGATNKLIKEHYHQLLENNKNLQAKSSLPTQRVFELAMTGYLQLKEAGELNSNKQYLSIIDFSLNSTQKRFWLVNLESSKVVYHSLIAHGKNTGLNEARYFSNTMSSNKSSLGFYATGNTYQGKHGLSMYLHGMDQGYNDNAKQRAIVMHGADYVSEQFVRIHGRLGRSLGCPALPMSNYKEIINIIAGGTCLFIYYPSYEYIQNSTVLEAAISTNISSSFVAEEN